MFDTIENDFMVASDLNDLVDIKPIELNISSQTNRHNFILSDDIKSMLQETPELNEARIAFLKMEIQRDRYQMDSHVIAEHLLEELPL